MLIRLTITAAQSSFLPLVICCTVAALLALWPTFSIIIISFFISSLCSSFPLLAIVASTKSHFFFCPSLSSSFICLHNSLIDSDRPLFYQSISVCCGLFYPHPSLHPIPSISPLLLLIKTVCSFEYKMKGKKIRRKNKHKQGQIKR